MDPVLLMVWLFNLILLNVVGIFALEDFSDVKSNNILSEIHQRLEIITKELLETEEDSTSIWHSSAMFDFPQQNREELDIRQIKLDDTFKYGYGVTEWYKYPMGTKQYAIGLRETGLNVLTLYKNGHVDNLETELDDLQPISVAAGKIWNGKEMEVILACLITGVESDRWAINWYHLQSGLRRITHWDLSYESSKIRMFENDNKIHVFVLNNPNLDVYEFEIDPSNFWSIQHKTFTRNATDMLIHDSNGKVYLIVTLPEQLIVFQYNPDARIYTQKMEMPISGLEAIANCQLGYRNYLLVGGDTLHVFELAWNIVNHPVDNVEFGLIRRILPVKVTTYRDEMVILVEHSIEIGDEYQSAIVLLYYHDGRIQKHATVPCSYYGDLKYGLGCMIQEESDIGLAGGISLELADTSMVLLPRPNSHSELFDVEARLIPVPNPIENDLKEFLSRNQEILKMYQEQQETIAQLQQFVHFEGVKSQSENMKINPEEDHHITVDVKQIRDEIQKIRDDIHELNEELNDAVFKNDSAGLIFNEPLFIADNGLEIRGSLHVQELFVDHINAQPVDEVLNDTVKRNEPKPVHIRGEKIFTNDVVQVDDLHFLELNGIPGSSIATNTADNEDIIINGNLIVNGASTILGDISLNDHGRGLINNINFKQDIVRPNHFLQGNVRFHSLNIRGDVSVTNTLNNRPIPHDLSDFITQSSDVSMDSVIRCKTLLVAGSIRTTTLNDVDLDDLLRRLFMKNRKEHFTDPIQINGKLFTSSNITLTTLNGFNFMKDFLFAREHSFSTINGKKNFSTLSSITANIRDSLNGLDLNSFVTLNDRQTITGEYQFEDLEVTEQLQVDGAIISNKLPKFLPNPTLSEVTKVLSNVNFKELHVTGEIIVEGDVNGVDWDELMGDVIFKDDPEPLQIPSVKQFQQPLWIGENLQITSNIFNRQNISQLVNKFTNEILTVNNLNGYTTINHLHVEGLYNDVNITDLDQNSIKLFGDQYIAGEIIFNEISPNLTDFLAVNLDITDTVNEMHVDEFRDWIENGRIRRRRIEVENLGGEEVFVDGSLIVNNVDFNPRNFLTGEVPTEEYYTAGTARDVGVEFLNGMSMKELMRAFKSINQYEENLRKGAIFIQEIWINGSVEVKTINGETAQELYTNSYYLHNMPTYGATVEFMDDVIFQNLTLENWNGIPFESTITDIISKKSDGVILRGLKTFKNGFNVVENISTSRVNDILVQDIFTVNDLELQGVLEIYGNVTIKGDLKLTGHLNDMTLYDLEQLATTDESGNCIINNDITIYGCAIKDLYLSKQLNEVDFQDFLRHLIQKDSHVQIPASFRFLKGVHFTKDLTILKRYNDIENVYDFLENIVILDKDVILTHHLTFKNDIEIQNKLTIRADLETKYLTEQDVAEWKKNVIMLDEDMYVQGSITFLNISVQDAYVSILNGVDMSRLILLNANQEMEVANFNRIWITQDDLPVGGRVNNILLTDAYKTTMKKNQLNNTTFTSKLIFHKPVFVQNINLLEPVAITSVEGNVFLDCEKIVLLDSDETLNATYTFKNRVQIDNDLFATNIQDVDLKRLQEKGIQRYKDGSKPQVVTGDWNVHGKVRFENDLNAEANVSEMGLAAFLERKKETIAAKEAFVENSKETYNDMCASTQKVLNAVRKQAYLFKYFQLEQILEEYDDVHGVFVLQHNNENYLLISLESLCTAPIYKWRPTNGNFEKIEDINVNSIHQVINIKPPQGSRKGHFVTRSSATATDDFPDCENGVQLWSFTHDDNARVSFQHEYHITNSSTHTLRESPIPDVFYGLEGHTVYEYNIGKLRERTSKHDIPTTRTWRIINPSSGLTFVPHEFGLGLSVRDNDNVYRIRVKAPSIAQQRSGNDGSNVTLMHYYRFPFDTNPETISIPVEGSKDVARHFTAVVVQQATRIKGKTGVIKIYEDVFNGQLFDVISAQKPSHLSVLDFHGNGETYLLFLENEKVVQIYQYKGIEGFKHHSTLKQPGGLLRTVQLPVDGNAMSEGFVLVADKNRVMVVRALVDGRRRFSDTLSPEEMDVLQCDVH